MKKSDIAIFTYAFSVFFVLFDCITIFLTGLVGLTANLRIYKERKCSGDRKSTRLNSSHLKLSRMPSSA